MSEEIIKEMEVEVEKDPAAEFCGQCKTGKYVDGKCTAYSLAGQQRWIRLRGCSLGNVNLDAPKEVKKEKVNPLKASKRAKKGK